MSAAPYKSDFVNVRLSSAGRRFAGEHGVVRIANAHMAYSFKDDAIERVLTSEWTKVLSPVLFEGQAVFETATDQVKQAAVEEEKHDATEL